MDLRDGGEIKPEHRIGGNQYRHLFGQFSRQDGALHVSDSALMGVPGCGFSL